MEQEVKISKSQAMIEDAEQVFYKTYNRFPVVFDRGEGVFLYDTDQTCYLDFGAGIAVAGLGYHNTELDDAIKAQVDKLLHTSNLFYNQPAIEAGKKLLQVSGMEKVFFTNSGTEAIEGAVKIAKRYAFNKDGKHGHEIIAMKHSFHGRSLGALSVTGNDHYQEPFRPLLPGVKFAEFNNLDSVKELITDNTCAILMETVQGEGGIYPADLEFLAGVRRLCDEHDMLMVLDEIQCGMGRSGNMFAWQGYSGFWNGDGASPDGWKPDVVTVAKALGNGMPIGAFLASGKASQAMVPGDHGTTYGGNPLVCAAASKILDLYKEKNILGHVNEIAPYMQEKLKEIAGRHEAVKAFRGKGLICGLEFKTAVAPVIRHALLEEKLILISAGTNVIRFVPPLVIEKQHVDEMAERLERSICTVLES